MQSTSSLPCPACGATAPDRGLERSGFTYRACGRCALEWLDPLPTAAQTEALYDSTYFTQGAHAGYTDYLGEERLHRRNAQRRIRLMDRAGIAPPGHLLDLGCAAGFLLSEARDRGWTVHGMDVSAWAAEQVRRRLDIEVFRSTAQIPRELFGSFSAVTLFQSLEHMADPATMLIEARALLRDDGALFIETWDRRSWIARLMGKNWQQVSPPSVVWLFNRRSLAAMLERAGLRLVAWRRTGKEVSVGFVAQLLAQKHPFLRRPLSVCTRYAWLSRLAMMYKLGDLVTLVARPIAPA